ncbi:PAS domain-containing sensor histidine kinase [Amycolatopsis marina]|nr:PAS domain-containing sensor histidine kinase [Amycolatopsis marina]
MTSSSEPPRREQWRHRDEPSDESFRLFIHNVRDYAIFMLDAQGHVATWNTGAERIKGYRANEIIGRHFSTFYPIEDIVSDKPGRELAVAAVEGRFEDEGWRLRKDGSRFWANVVITAVFDESGTLQGFGKATRDMTERVRAEQALHNRRRLFAHLVKAQEMERRRIAWDVHDDSIQAMVAASMRLQLLASRVDDVQRQEVDMLLRSVDSSITRLRNLVFRLRPPELDDEGLADAIGSYLRQVSAQGGFEFRLAVELSEEPEQEVSVTIFRIIQEALANVQKHANAKNVEVLLRSLGYGVHVTVRDDGVGADLPAVRHTATDHFGFMDMHERAEAAGGWWKVTSEPGAGLSVDFWVPTNDDAARLIGTL